MIRFGTFDPLKTRKLVLQALRAWQFPCKVFQEILQNK
jgi:hypothetical protein